MRKYFPILPIILLIGILSLALSAQRTRSGAANVQQAFLPFLARRESPTWIGPDGGSITALAIDPVNPLTIYAGTWGAGIFKSSDDGLSWQAVNQGLGKLLINSLAIDPITPTTLYAGTYKAGIYKSIDGGGSWFPINQGIQAEAVIYTIAIDPGNPAVIYLGTRGISNQGSAPWSGVTYKSYNAGMTWTPLLTNIAGEQTQDWFYSIAIHPTASYRLYAAAHVSGAYRSRDAGITWEGINQGIEDTSGRAILVDPATGGNSTLYMGVWYRTGVYKSTADGDEWGLVNYGIGGSQVYTMALDPFSPETLYAATFGMGLRKTTDGALIWKSAGLPAEDIYSIATHPQVEGRLFGGTHGDGLYYTTGNDYWVHRQAGIRAASVTDLLPFVDDPNRLLAGLDGGGVSSTSDGGTTWQELNAGLGDKIIHALVGNPAQPQIIFALTDHSGLFYTDISTDTGWLPVNAGLPLARVGMEASGQRHPYSLIDPVDFPVIDPTPATDEKAPLLAMAFAPSNGNIAYLGSQGGGIYKSSDGGWSWSQSGLSERTVRSLVIDPRDANVVYAATEITGTVKVSRDGGKIWGDTQLPSGLTIYSISLSAARPDVIYAGTGYGVYTLTDGLTWAPTALIGRQTPVVASHPVRSGLVFAAYDTGGVMVSTDGGSSWQPGPVELEDKVIQAIIFDQNHPDLIYFCTSTQGVLRVFFNP